MRKSKEEYYDKNKGNSNYLSFDYENSSDSDIRKERGYKTTLNGKFKLTAREKTYEDSGIGKRKKLNLE